jgi:hypothetical protein
MGDASQLRGTPLNLHLLLHPGLSSKIRVGRLSLSSFIPHCCPSPLSSSSPVAPLPTQRSLEDFVCLFLAVVGKLLIRDGSKANQPPPRIAQPLSRHARLPRDRVRRPLRILDTICRNHSSNRLIFPICDIARWEALDINSVPLRRSFILLSWNWRSDARSQLLVPSEKLPPTPTDIYSN